MSFLLPKLSPTSSLLSTTYHAKLSQNPLTNQVILPAPPSNKLTALQERTVTETEKRNGNSGNRNPKDEFYLNLGIAVRTLRDDLPALFVKDLNYEIYRDDITFVDPLNTFQGLQNYKTIFWALRFHARLLFQEISFDISRIYQLSETSIIIRWELHGTPRVPWESHGTFQGTSKYKLDRNGKIYEHKVDNLALNFPKVGVRSGSVLDLVGARPATCPVGPGLGFWGEGLGLGLGLGFGGEGCTWAELYEKVKGSLEEKEGMEVGMEGMISCCL